MTKNNLIYQILKLELSKLKSGILINNINFIKDCEKLRFCIYLNASGFDLELVEKQLIQLEDNKKWRRKNNGEEYIGFISNCSVLVDEMKIAFTILKTDFITFINNEGLDIKI